MVISRKEYERLCEENKKLKEKYDELRFRVIPSNNLLNEFEYAVLRPKDECRLVVWNNGRFEDRITSVEISQEVGLTPYFKIEKI